MLCERASLSQIQTEDVRLFIRCGYLAKITNHSHFLPNIERILKEFEIHPAQENLFKVFFFPHCAVLFISERLYKKKRFNYVVLVGGSDFAACRRCAMSWLELAIITATDRDLWVSKQRTEPREDTRIP